MIKKIKRIDCIHYIIFNDTSDSSLCMKNIKNHCLYNCPYYERRTEIEIYHVSIRDEFIELINENNKKFIKNKN